MAFGGKLGDRARHCESYVLICCTMTGRRVRQQATFSVTPSGTGSVWALARLHFPNRPRYPVSGGCDLLLQTSVADQLTGAQSLFPPLAKSNALWDGDAGAGKMWSVT
jgi:hypothetical protein